MRNVLMAILVISGLAFVAMAQDNDAEKLYRAMEKKLLEAKAVQFKVTGEIKTANRELDSSYKGTVLLGQDNKVRVKLSGDFGGDARSYSLVSNGKQLKRILGSMEETTADTPKHLRRYLLFFMNRTGLLVTLQGAPLTLGFADMPPEDYFKGADRDRAAVWAFKVAATKKWQGGEAKVVTFRYGPRDEEGLPVTVWIDAKTSLPVKFIIQPQKNGGMITETYEVNVAPTIAAKDFEP